MMPSHCRLCGRGLSDRRAVEGADRVRLDICVRCEMDGKAACGHYHRRARDRRSCPARKTAV